jgi:hypothetical protein
MERQLPKTLRGRSESVHRQTLIPVRLFSVVKHKEPVVFTLPLPIVHLFVGVSYPIQMHKLYSFVRNLVSSDAVPRSTPAPRRASPSPSRMNPLMNTVFLRAAAVRQRCRLLYPTTPLHQSPYMTWLRYEVLTMNQETGSAIITDLELANPGDANALMHAFEHNLGIVTQNHPDLSFGAPAA